mgnify:CR=1 FL=1|nr:MAG TPA: DNA binding protein [Microviridae sp.]
MSDLSVGAKKMLESHEEYNETDLEFGSMDCDGIFSIFDNCAGVYCTPFIMENRCLAVRCFSDYCMVPDTSISKHPEDYSLFQLGEYNKKTGQLLSFKNPRLLTRALTVIFDMKHKLSEVKEPEKSSVTEDNTDLSVKEVGENE